MNIDRLRKVPLRELWPHEAYDFTAWLCENLDLMAEAIDLELTLVEREAAAGPFAADILAEGRDGLLAVIENQLERTDHDHLGKLITYLSNLDAKTAIWISSDPRPEHERAVHFLNEILPADSAIYLLRIEAVRIGESPAAPLFTVVAGPSIETKVAGVQKVELAGRHLLRTEFWQGLLELAKGRTKLHANISPSDDNWISAGAGHSGLAFNYVIRKSDGQVEFYIGRNSAEENKRIFDALLARRAQIETAFGSALDWQRLDDKRGSRVRFVLTGSGLADREHWTEVQDKMIDAMIRLHQALQPELKLQNIR